LRELVDRAGLPFQDLLSGEVVAQALAAEGVLWRECVYTPEVTLRTFLWQVLSPDHSCRDAVAQLMAHQLQHGGPVPSPETDPYCKARRRLPEEVCARLMREAGKTLDESVSDFGRLAGRPVKLVDGTTLSMPDTRENQAAYPQAKTQRPGVGFPIMRLVAVLSLGSAAAREIAMGPYSGKETGETALFRALWDSLSPADIVAGDRYFATFWDLALLQQRGVDSVYRQHHLRPSDFRRGQRLGRDDHLLRWKKPARPDWMDEAAYDSIKDEITVREVRVRVRRRGWRVRELVLVTTLLDDALVTRDDLAHVYLQRCGSRSAFDQVHAADGRAALQDAGNGSQGSLDAPAGLQSGPHRDGSSGNPSRPAAARDQLQGGLANRERLSRHLTPRPRSRTRARAGSPLRGDRVASSG
jgi:hypothetical protein